MVATAGSEHLLVEVVFSSLCAGVVVMIATTAIEKFGGAVGGVLSTVPSTVVPVTIAFYYEVSGGWGSMSFQDPAFKRYLSCAIMIPFGMVLNAFVLFLWKVLPARFNPEENGVYRTCAIVASLTLAFWLLGALFSVGVLSTIKAIFGEDNTFVMLFLSISSFVLMVGLGAYACWNMPESAKAKNKITLPQLLARGVLAAVAVGTAVLLTKINDFLAGVFSAFPAVFLSTMIALYLQQGAGVQGGAAGPMMLGSGTVSVYALLSIPIFPTVGLLLGFPIVYILSVALVSIPSYMYLEWRRKNSGTFATFDAVAVEDDDEKITEISLNTILADDSVVNPFVYTPKEKKLPRGSPPPEDIGLNPFTPSSEIVPELFPTMTDMVQGESEQDSSNRSSPGYNASV